jgi:rhodanese-related sulfurtransferase
MTSSTTLNAGSVRTMTPQSFNNLLKDFGTRSSWQIIDVREPDEVDVSKVAGNDIIYLPLSDSSSWAQTITTGKLLDSSKKTACLCHHGVRSLKVANFLGKRSTTLC